MKPRAPILAALAAIVALEWSLFGVDAFAQEPYSSEEFERLAVEADEAVLASDALGPGSGHYVEARRRAFDTQRAVYRYLNAWMRSGTMPDEYMADAEANQWQLLVNLSTLAAQMGRCATAQSLSQLMLGQLDTTDSGRQASYDTVVSEVESCVDTVGTHDSGPPSEREQDAVGADAETHDHSSWMDEPRARRRANNAGVLLIAGGAIAFLLGAGAPDCAQGEEGCDSGPQSNLEYALASDRALASGLLVGGALALVTGALLCWEARAPRVVSSGAPSGDPKSWLRALVDGVEFMPQNGGGELRVHGTW